MMENNADNELVVCDNICELCHCASSDVLEYIIDDDIKYLCRECFEREYGNYMCCSDCGVWYETYDMTSVNDGEYHVCLDCINNYYECECCGNAFVREDLEDTRDGYVCRDCVDRHDYRYLSCCEVYSRDYNYCSSDDNYYCDAHMPECCIYDYHEFSDWETYKGINEEDVPYYIGFELEVENYGDMPNDNVAKDIMDDYIPCICARDGSLNNGFEIISHPLSAEYFYEHSNLIESMLERLQASGFKSHDTSTCGLHFHITRPSDEVIDRIILVMETFKDEIIKLSRRSNDEITRWCDFYSDKKNHPFDSLYYISKNKEVNSRYMALNLENTDTIEFRIFKGTLDFNSFMACFELVNNIVKFCSDLKVRPYDITWKKLTSTSYLKKYVEKRGIYSEKRVKNNDKVYKDAEKELKVYKKKVIDCVIACCKVITREVNNLKVISELPSFLESELIGLESSIISYKHILERLCVLKSRCEDDTMSRSDIELTIEVLLNRYDLPSDVKKLLEGVL